MRRSWTSWLSAGVVGAAIAAAAPGAAALGCRAGQPCCDESFVPVCSDPGTTRIFAVQPKLDLAWMQTRQTYHDKVFALADTSLRGPDKPLIQDGADDFTSHLRPDGRNLVLWPEDTGLWAAFTGRRGDAARSSGSLPGAVGALLTGYSPQVTYYSQKYPTVAGRAPQVRLLALALTDTFGRVVLESFSEMAAKYHVWLEVGVDMAQSWQVVCVGGAHPPQQPCDEENPQKVAQLGDPDETDRGYAYEATSPDASNMALVFDPTGKLVSKQIKTYLTPIELGQAEGQTAALDLVPGSITSGLNAVATPVGTLGFVTSKDAWMPDVLDRLEEQHVDVLVQPEFFVGDVATTTGMWAADTLKASGYNDLLRHPGFDAMALPSMVGNVFDFTADQQTQIAVRRAKPTGGGWLIGQPPAPGLAATPWVVPDPLSANEPFPERRKRLGEAGQKLVPGSGVACPDPAKPGPCENGHVETVLWQDVPVGTPPFKRFRGKRVRTRFSRAHALDRGRAAERNTTIALAGRYGALAFEHSAGPHDRVYIATSRDGGRHWTRPVAAVDALGDEAQQWPALALDAKGHVTLAWTAGTVNGSGVLFAQGNIGRAGVAFGRPDPIDPEDASGASQWKPALAQGAGGVVDAVFVSARARSADAGLPQAGVYYTRIGADGQPEAASVRIDQGPPDPLSAKLDNAWSPSLVVRGNDVLITWLDFMHYDWDVLSRISHDGGQKFEPQVDSNREPADVEDLSDSPRPLLTDAGPLIAWTDFHKRDSAAQTPHEMYDTYLAAPGKDPVQVDPFGGKQASTFWPSACSVKADAIVAFQDSSTGVGRIRITRVRGGATRGHAFVVNDTKTNAYRPAVACGNGRVVAAWEDARHGLPRIYTSVASLKKLR